MRISTATQHKVIVVATLVSLVLFFGYVGYRDLFYDPTTSAEQKLASQVENLNDSVRKPRAYYGAKRAQIALAEYRKGVVETPMGCNCGPEVDKYTEGYHAQWCTMFASWVAKEAGSPLLNEKTNSWRILNSRDFAKNLEQNGTWYSREEIIQKGLQPKVGDFVVFWRGDFEDNLGHVDIVVDTDRSPGTAGLVGGNLSPGQVKYRDFPYLQNYGFLGFGRPEKENE